MEKITRLKFFLLFFLTSLNKLTAYHGLLNNNMALYNNSSLISGGVSLCCLPFSELKEKNITKFFTDIYIACDFQRSWLLQTNYVARVLGFFPYFGVEIFYTTLKLFLLRSLTNIIDNKNFVTSFKQGFPGALNVIFNFEPEYDFSFKRRCCQQIGIGISFLQIDRCIHGHENNNVREENALSLGGYTFIDLCLIHKLKMKIKYNTNTEIHISFGYVYNPLLLHMFIDRKEPKNIKINEPGLFNFFFQFNIASINDKGDETITWFNNGKEIYKRIGRRLRHSFSFPPFFVGSYYSKQQDDFIRKLFTGFYYCFSSPYLLSFSKVHYLGLYFDINLCMPEFRMNTNSTFGISFTSNYKSVIFEHNIGVYIFADGGIFNQREISSVTIGEKNKELRKPISNRLVYRPRLYLNIHRFFVDLKKHKKLWSVLKRIRLFVGINIMLYTITNTKDILTNKNSGKQYYDYIPAQVESYIFGFAIE